MKQVKIKVLEFSLNNNELVKTMLIPTVVILNSQFGHKTC